MHFVFYQIRDIIFIERNRIFISQTCLSNMCRVNGALSHVGDKLVPSSRQTHYSTFLRDFLEVMTNAA